MDGRWTWRFLFIVLLAMLCLAYFFSDLRIWEQFTISTSKEEVETHQLVTQSTQNQPLLQQHTDEELGYSTHQKPPNGNYMLGRTQGRFGNELFNFAAVIGIARRNGHTPITAYKGLQSVFKLGRKKIELKNPMGVHDCEAKAGVYCKDTEDLPKGRNITIFGYRQSFKYFDFVGDEVRAKMTFKNSFQTAAEDILHRHKDGDRLFVGIHVRHNPDNMDQRKYKPAGEQYFINALSFYRKILKDPIFIIITDDIPWCQSVFTYPDTHVIETDDQATDFAVAANCNHSIVSIGTFSWWTGYLTGGLVLYYKEFPFNGKDRNLYRFEDYYPPYWIGMNNSELFSSDEWVNTVGLPAATVQLQQGSHHEIADPNILARLKEEKLLYGALDKKPVPKNEPVYFLSKSKKGLGNRMFSIASTFGVAQHYNATAVTDSFDLVKVFPNLKPAPTKELVNSGVIKDCKKKMGVYCIHVESLNNRKNYTATGYLHSFKYFKDYKQQLKSKFTLKESMQQQVEAIVKPFRDTGRPLVSVHVRIWGKKNYNAAPIEYFTNAMGYLRNKLSNPLFLVIGDDFGWCQRYLKGDDVHVVSFSKKEVYVDFGIAMSCEHSIVSVGPFSWWTGFLTDGMVVFYSNWPFSGELSYSYTKEDFIPPHWVGINETSPIV